MSHRKSVLAFAGCYLPGFKGGGPIRSLSNLFDRLGEEVCFALVTSDRDLGEKNAYSGVRVNLWASLGAIRVYYASPGVSWLFRLWRIIREFDGDAIYLSGFFSFRFSILPVLLWRVLKAGRPLIVAPKGEFSRGALGLKALKKGVFIRLARFLRIYRGVVWAASSQHEAEDIYRVMGAHAVVRIASNISSPPSKWHPIPRNAREPLCLVFLSRISPMKNLVGALEVLGRVSSSVMFDVYGPIEDIDYWEACQAAAERLPENVRFSYRGALYPTQVPGVLEGSDLLFLPTFGENFGHVIAESLGCGVPVLISTQTPWRFLEDSGLGWDIPLENTQGYVDAIEHCCRISDSDYAAWRYRIRSWALNNLGGEEVIEQNKKLFIGLGW